MNHYHALGLLAPDSHARQGQILSKDRLRQAYRTSLLRYHPDKASSLISSSQSAETGEKVEPAGSDVRSHEFHDLHQRAPTVDEIKTAYTVLSDSSLRTAYDRELLFKPSVSALTNGPTSSRLTGDEMIDLDDMVLDDTSGDALIWTRSCRCGQDRGFEVREAELDAAMAKGEREVVVGCHGCSLWIRVAFDAANEAAE